MKKWNVALLFISAILIMPEGIVKCPERFALNYLLSVESSVNSSFGPRIACFLSTGLRRGRHVWVLAENLL